MEANRSPFLEVMAFLSLAAVIALICVGAGLWWLRPPPLSKPDFTALPAGEARKQAFFSYLQPLLMTENAAIEKERAALLAMTGKPVLSPRQQRMLAYLACKYEVTDPGLSEAATMDILLTRVDVIPESLSLAQAAKESGWGTSRFAVIGNNYFGQRCYVVGCGMVPSARPAGAIYEVATFDSPRHSVASYLRNLNSHYEYETLRGYRAQAHAKGLRVTGLQLAERLTQYSERRQAYVDEIQSLIHFNKLDNTP